MTVNGVQRARNLSQRIVDLCAIREILVGKVQVVYDQSGRFLVQVERISQSLEFRLEDFNPDADSLPKIWLITPNDLFAHVCHARIICINDEESLSIDARDPEGVLATVAVQAIEVIEKSEVDAKSGLHEFFDEIEGYWSHIPAAYWVQSAVEVDDNPRAIYAHFNEKAKPRECVYFTEHEDVSKPIEFRVKKLAKHIGIYLPLATNVPPPRPGEDLDSSFVRQVISNLPPKALRAWEDISRRWKKGRRLVPLLVSQPRKSGRSSLIGLMFYLNNGEIDDARPVVPLKIRRHTAEFMRERGGANLALASKHVAVIGCGSVGSEVADALATSGVGKLTLVDPEPFEVENVFRHALGRQSIGLGKADSLERDLSAKYPLLQVTSAPLHGLPWIKKASLAGIDGLVIAVGQPMVERHLIEAIRRTAFSSSIVVTWLEPLGLGGHAISLSGSGPGCMGCVYRDEAGQQSLMPRISFLEADQKISRNLTGCSGTFTPYSALHSRRTALLATESLLQLFEGKMPPRYNYWVGDATNSIKANIKTSKWFEIASKSNQEEASMHLFAHPCASCGGIS